MHASHRSIRLRWFHKSNYEGKKMGPIERALNHRVCGTKAESGVRYKARYPLRASLHLLHRQPPDFA